MPDIKVVVLLSLRRIHPPTRHSRESGNPALICLIALVLAQLGSALAAEHPSAVAGIPSSASSKAEISQPPPRRMIKAPVVVDGRELFRVGDSGTYDATERAGLINDRLADELCLSAPAELAVVAHDDMPTIRLNGQHLVSIDEVDVVPGVDPDEQAQMWLQAIKTALDQSRA